MLKAQLSYNPYLSETKVTFNDKKPRINSLVEKYEDAILHDWVDKIPSIFYDEMNGYGFELEFNGTELDFEDVRKAFLHNGVSENQVRLVNKGVLSSRFDKSKSIDDLFNWIKKSKNINFDYLKFREEYANIIDTPYPFVIICSEEIETPVISWVDALPEIITNVSDLDRTDLLHTPIVICVDEKNYYEIQSISKRLIRRVDVSSNQIFYILKNFLNETEVKRTIKDSGIEQPNFITMLDDEKIKNYFEMYPITDYIQTIIKGLNRYIIEANNRLEIECSAGVESNSEGLDSVEKISKEIELLKYIDDDLSSNSISDYKQDFEMIRNEMVSFIGSWRKKNTKIISEDDAQQYATELEEEVKKYFNICIKSIDEKQTVIKNSIDKYLRDKYHEVQIDVDFEINRIELEKPKLISSPKLKEKLLELKVENEVMRKEGGLFFAQNKTHEEATVKVTTYYYQEWRNYVANTVNPLLEELIIDRNTILINYEQNLVDAYKKHIEELISERNTNKENLLSKLSDDEKRIQNDVSWLSDLREHVESIMRD